MKMELRTLKANELRSDKNEAGEMTLKGYVNETGAWSQPLGLRNKFKERIMPGTFQRSVNNGHEILLLGEHDNSKLLASTRNGSLKLNEDSKGLYFEARIADTSAGRDFYTYVNEGLIEHMSFGFKDANDKWGKDEDGMPLRTIDELHLAEISIVRNPAYIQSSVSARNIELVEDVFFIPENKNNTEESIMSKEKQLKEMKEQMAALEAEVRAENASATEVRAEIEPKVDKKEVEIRAVEQFIRKQNGEELRELTAGAGVGQLTVPTTLSNLIVQKLQENAPLFARTKNFTPVNGFLEILREKTIGTAGFVGEMTDLAKDDFTMDKVRLDQKRVGTAIELSQHLVNDSGINVVNYAVNVLSRRLGLTIDNSILLGDKATQFEGILVDPDNTIKKVTTAGVGAITIDDLLDLHLAMHPAYVGEAVFVMNRKTFNAIAKLKDTFGQFYLVRDVSATGVSYRLFGNEVLINDSMPDLATGSKAVLFANFGEAYATMTKKGITLQHISGDTTQALRGSHLLLLDAYMDGKFLNQEAMKLLVVQ